MGIPLAIALLVVGIGLLGYGADVLVRGAVTLAKAARMPVAVIGLTVVAMGTSLPELTVSVTAALRGAVDVGVGNIIGSNIFNVAVVLGLSALILPIRVHGNAVRLEWPFMFLASFQLLLLARDGTLDRLEAAFFLSGLILFTFYVVRVGRKELEAEERADLTETVEAKARDGKLESVGGALLLVSIGVGLLVIGGDVLLRGALEIARASGMTERVIGLTVVAAGTSVPEVATSIIAARRGQSEIALGNVIGSNILNILGILGLTALVRPLMIAPQVVSNDLWWMLAFSLALLPMMASRFIIGRIEGFLLVAGYVTYVTLLAFGA